MSGSLLSYENLTYSVRLKNGESRVLVDGVSVAVRAGELLAIMGPSGAGKSTLLDLMTFRKPALPGHSVQLNGQKLTSETMHKIAAFVEQDDALMGTLTPRESVAYSLRLHSPHVSPKEVAERVDTVLSSLGLQSCADQSIRTPFGRGISDGQKRRVTAACAMVTYPQILFLDEVTSGLDSTASREIIGAIRKLALAEGMIVVTTIHQPSVELMSQFDNLLMLAKGKTCYYGSVNGLEGFLEEWGKPTPRFMTPFEHAMNFLNDDFVVSDDLGRGQPVEMHDRYLSSQPSKEVLNPDAPKETLPVLLQSDDFASGRALSPNFGYRVWILSKRNFLNYSRSLHSYGIRAVMYLLLAAFISTLWLRLGTEDSTINDRISLHFFISCFLGMMSVACIPGFLEERAVYLRESKNGLYTTLPFVTAHALTNLPLLFTCAITLVSIQYPAVGVHPGAGPFFRYFFFIFLTVLIGETQTLVTASFFPDFVQSLAITVGVSAFFICLSGFFIKARSMPRFWYYTFHQVDYLRYGFELLVTSDLRGLTFQCLRREDGSCACAYPSKLNDACSIAGEDVLEYLEITNVSYAKWSGILLGFLVFFRILGYVGLKVRTR